VRRGHVVVVHHLNCATMCPIARRLVSGEGGVFERGHMVAHCLLVEHAQGLVLVDSGFGLRDCADAASFPVLVRGVLGARFDPLETAHAQVRRLGFRPEDVRDVVVTHLDLDHAGGLADFPWARVHLHARELAAFRAPRWNERARYVPAQLAHGPRFEIYEEEGDRWLGLRAAYPLRGLDGLALLPLFGHTRGHAGVVVEGGAGDRALLHAGDAYFHRDAVRAGGAVPIGLRIFESIVEAERAPRLANAAFLRAVATREAARVRVVSAHDPFELAASPKVAARVTAGT
jgi:glyoxylase-like metal-dependent hydrolase (beta-lactamase superfamily II)